MSYKRTILIVVVAIMTSILLAVPSALGQEKRVLEVWDFWSRPFHLALFDEVKAAFEAANPGVEVRYNVFTGGVQAFGERIITAIATGDAPDVAQASVAFVRDLYDAGLLLPLNNYIDRTPELQPHQFFPNTQIYNQVDGVFFGIPLVLDTNVLFKNIDHFDETGLDHSPHGIDSWDTFSDYATKLTRYNNAGDVTRSGYSASLGRAEWNVWLAANGGRLYNDSFTGFDLATDEVVGAVEFLLDLRNRGQIAPSGAGVAFTAGRTSMQVAGAHLPLTALDENPSLRLVETTVPVGPLGTQRAVAGWGNMMIITKDAKEPDLAWDYITFYAGLEGQKLIAKHIGRPGIPRFDFYQTDEWFAMLGANPWMATLPEIYQSAQPYTALIKPMETERIMDQFLTQIRTGTLDPRSALEEMNRLLNVAVE